MSTALEHTHELEPHFRVARARAGVLLLIVSDALSVIAVLAAGGYLKALNVEGQYIAKGDHGPAFLPALVVAILLVLSAVAYFWGEQRVRKHQGAGQQIFFILALLFMIVALVIQIRLGATLGYSAPFDAYQSMTLLITWYSAAHFLLAAIIGLLFLGRVMRGRLSGHDYVTEVVGYWWYYTVVASLLLWLFGAFIA